MENIHSVDPSPRVRQKKRKSGDMLNMSPELTFVFEARHAHGEDETAQWDPASRSLDRIKKTSQYEIDSNPIPPEMQVKFEPLNDSQLPSKRNKMSRVTSMPRLDLLPNSTVGAAAVIAAMKSTVARLQAQNRMSSSISAPSLQDLVTQPPEAPDASAFAATNPDHYLFDILKELGVADVQTRPSLDVKNFFFEYDEANINSYNADTVAVVRRGDVPALRQMKSEGRMLQCCNKFGESILHAACRRGSYDVVRFLLEEGGVELRLRDDYGRTPLHDACWTREPEIDLVQLLISKCPEMLLLTDKRGFTPLAYVRKAHWGQWCEFLDSNRHLLAAMQVL